MNQEEIGVSWLTKRVWKLIPETRWRVSRRAISDFRVERVDGKARVTTDEELLL